MTTNGIEELVTEGMAQIGQAAFPDRDAVGLLVDGEPSHAGPGDLDVRYEKERTSRRSNRHVSPVLIAACLFGVMAVAGALAVGRGSPEREPAMTDRAQAALDQVVPIAEAPLAPRWLHVSARVGDEMIIWGGEDADVAQGSEASSTADAAEQYDDGAAYDLRTGAWRTIAPSPLSARERAHSTVFDGEVYVVGGVQDGVGNNLRDAAAYNPATDSWRRLPDAPPCPRNLVPTAAGVMVIAECDAGAPVEAALYDPAQDRWSAIAAPPVQGHGLVVENAGLVVVTEAITERLFTYDIPTGSWNDIGTPPFKWSEWIQGRAAIVVTDDGGVVAIATTQPTEANSDTIQLVSWHPDQGWDEARIIDAPAPDTLSPRPLVVVDSRIAWMGEGDVAWYDQRDGSVGTVDLRAHGVGLAGSPETVLSAAPRGDLVVWGGSHGETGSDAQTGAVVHLP